MLGERIPKSAEKVAHPFSLVSLMYEPFISDLQVVFRFVVYDQEIKYYNR